ncbi:hypothetical protein HDU91_007265 [Kappamyces sp. JEL0680]|nr:hypothetical protein HDU91_007265 [Kappamyces sp. JEL0680]
MAVEVVKTPQTFTWQEIKASAALKNRSSKEVAQADSCLFVIKNKVYDISGEEFAKWHPGGSVALTQIGLDATGPFEGFHEPASWLLLQKYYVGDLRHDEIIPPTVFEKDVQEIRQKVKAMNLYKVNLFYYATIFSIILGLIASSFGIIALFPNQLAPLLVSGALLGLAFQQSGSEHALEGFSDLDDQALTKFMVSYQSTLIFPLLAFARLSWALSSILWNFSKDPLLSFPGLNGLEKALLLVHYTWYVGGGFAILSPFYAVVWAVSAQVFCGLFLASVFSLNHNGMPIYSAQEAGDMNFYELAIRTGRNVSPSLFNNWFTGGLNFQIEHHMFPTVPRHNLPKTAQMVQGLCKKHGIPYHSTGFLGGMQEIVERLAKVSKAATHFKEE